MEIVKLNTNHLNLIEELLKEQFGIEAWNKNQIESAFNSNTHFYGIFDQEKLVCVAGLLVGLDDLNLLDIATKNEYKRQGLSKKMLAFLLSLKKDNQTFSLEVKANNLPAISLYKKFGFKTLHIRKRYYKDGEDAFCMFLQQ